MKLCWKKDNLKARQTLQRIADSRTTFGVAPSLRYAEPPIGKYFMKCSSRHCYYISNTKSMRLLILEKKMLVRSSFQQVLVALMKVVVWFGQRILPTSKIILMNWFKGFENHIARCLSNIPTNIPTIKKFKWD